MKIYTVVLVVLVAMACGGEGGAGGVEIIAEPDWGKVEENPADQEFFQEHLALLVASVDMTPTELMEKWYEEPGFGDGPDFDVWTADFAPEIAAAWELTDDEKAGIAKEGFGVLDRVRFASHALGYEDVWVRDLPVLITTDSILFALHRSFDRMLKQVEEEALIPALRSILENLQAALGADGATDDPLLQLVREDLDLYYSVALSLLNGTTEDGIFPGTAEKRDDILSGVADLQPRPIELFGRPYAVQAAGSLH